MRQESYLLGKKISFDPLFIKSRFN